MGSKKEDQRRGLKESRIAAAALQERWPAAFPKEAHLIRPLVSRLAPVIAESMGWNEGYAQGVLKGWKSRAAYCKSVLREKYRYDLAGLVTTEEIDEEARGLATRQLAQLKRNESRRLERGIVKRPDQILADSITASR
jgi:sRNA-binding protein